jgi:hypothetical protein
VPHRLAFDGPDQEWSVDSHCKLDRWGIQIYAGIDAYSRFVPWCYTGISSHTVLSVPAQYLDILPQRRYRPHRLRSDRGKETIWLANIHYQLCVWQQQQAGEDSNIEFQEVYKYGTSKENVNKWWKPLSEKSVKPFRVRLCYLI